MTSGHRYLQVSLGDSISPPSTDQHLLVAFRFAADANNTSHPAVVDIALEPLESNEIYECWWVAEPVSYRRNGSIRIAECSDYAVLVQEIDEGPGDDLTSLTQNAYRETFQTLRSTDHSRMAKVWNYLGAINSGDGDNERYRQFSVGRASAFSEYALPDDASPAGTGIGTRLQRGLTIITLASRHPLLLAENPRQVSAFQYPRQYGPSSPKFARGAAVLTGSHALHLLSGTASIVGHESLHPLDVEAQLEETLRNIAALGGSLSVLDGDSVHRVYMREMGDTDAIATELQERLAVRRDQIVFLRGDICRRELLIEIDGVRVQETSRT